MIEREAWVKYPSNPNNPEVYPAVIKRVRILEFVTKQAYHNPINPNYDVSGEVVAVCIDLDTGKYSEEGLYWLYDKEPNGD